VQSDFSRIIRLGTRLIGNGGGNKLVQLDRARLLEEAERRVALAGFGDRGFLEPLGRLLDSFENEAGLSLLGRIAARQDVLRLLVNRLQMEDDRKRRPEIADESIARPLFVTGLPRTGTTLLHGLLAQDPEHRAPLSWEVMFPSPPSARHRNDRRIEMASRQLRWFHRLAPEFRKIHPIGPLLPEECLIITSPSFVSFQFQTSHSVPSYQTWVEAQDLRPSYEMHRRVLQNLQRHGRRGRWVLKAPAHLYGIDAIRAVYPDAGIVFTHRDPLQVVPSTASLHVELRSIFSDTVDPAAVGAEVSRRWAVGMERALQARDATPDAASRFYDVQYADLLCDPIATVRRLYLHFGAQLSEATESRMRSFLARNPKDKHGRHRYSLDQFGLDADEVLQQYASYRQRFGV